MIHVNTGDVALSDGQETSYRRLFEWIVANTHAQTGFQGKISIPFKSGLWAKPKVEYFPEIEEIASTNGSKAHQ